MLETLHWWLTDGSATENDAAISARSEWAGLAAKNFSSNHIDMHSSRNMLAGACLSLRDQISDAVNDAYWAQQRVNDLQDQWDLELQQEIDDMSTPGAVT